MIKNIWKKTSNIIDIVGIKIIRIAIIATTTVVIIIVVASSKLEIRTISITIAVNIISVVSVVASTACSVIVVYREERIRIRIAIIIWELIGVISSLIIIISIICIVIWVCIWALLLRSLIWVICAVTISTWCSLL